MESETLLSSEENDYPVPDDDDQRIHALEKFDLEKVHQEESFDRLTELASQFYETPIALVVLVGRDKAWFKSNHGIEEESTSRGSTFCTHAVYHNEVLSVEDAREDDRFANLEIVNGDTNIRSYLGAPLTTVEGHAIGTFCVIDKKPRQFDDDDIEQIQVFAEEAMSHIQLKQKNTELKEINDRLYDLKNQHQETKQRLEQMAENIGEVFWLWSSEGHLEYINNKVEDILGVDRKTILDDPSSWVEHVHEEDQSEVEDVLQPPWEDRFELEFRVNGPNHDEIHWVKLSGNPIRNDAPEKNTLAGTAEDVSDRKEAEQKLRQQARTDELTELYNRHYFFDRLPDEIDRAERYGNQLSLMMIDLNNFKQINDQFGHLAGDEVLNQVANLLENSIRGSDVPIRYGGDEFVVMMPQTSIENARRSAERIYDKLKSYDFELSTDDSDVPLECSIGLAEFDGQNRREEVEPQQFVNRADQAMFHAKKISDRSIEMRRDPRYSADSVDIDVELRHSNANITPINVSKSGLRVETDYRFSVGETFTFKISNYTDRNPVITRQGTVVWSKSAEDDNFRAGIKFHEAIPLEDKSDSDGVGDHPRLSSND